MPKRKVTVAERPRNLNPELEAQLQDLPRPAAALVRSTREYLQQSPVADPAAQALLVALSEAVILLNQGRDFVDLQYKLTKQECAQLHRMLAALTMQYGKDGWLEMDEKTWEATPEDKRIRGYVAENGNSVFKLSADEPLIGIQNEPNMLSLFDGIFRKHHWPEVKNNREQMESDRFEPQYLPVYQVTDYVKSRTARNA